MSSTRNAHEPVRENGTKSESLAAGELWFSAVWLVFLIIPVMLIESSSDAGAAWNITAYAAIAVFGATYLTAFFRLSRRHSIPGLALWVAALALIVVATVPALGVYVISFAPYFSALGLWNLPLRTGLAWSAGVVLLAVVIAFIPHGFERGLEQMLQMLGAYIAVAFTVILRILNERSEVSERMRRELATVQEREEISRDIHDLLGHSLTVISLKAQLARRLIDVDPNAAKHELDELLGSTSKALDEVRATVGRLRTPDLAAQLKSSKTALEAAEINYRIVGSTGAVPVERRALTAWALREGVTNLIRHSEAAEVTIIFHDDRFVITDNGTGIQNNEGHGLTGLRRRIEDAGATLDLSPAAPHAARPGTRLEVRFS